VDGLRHQHQLGDLLWAAGLSASTFYYQRKSLSAPDPDAAAKASVQRVFAEHRGRYGYRRVTAQLRREGVPINHKVVLRLMQAMGLKSPVRQKKFHSFRGVSHETTPNVLQRRFDAGQPNQAWVTDVTEFNVRGEKLYLSPVLDLYNGEIVAFQTDRRPTLDLVARSLRKAVTRLSDDQRPVVHSDQGWQYQQPAYRRLLTDRHLVQSMSRKGNCLDNAAMESFFAVLKSELFHLGRFDSIDQLQRSIRSYIHYYNHKRIKLKLKGLSPVEFRVQAFG